MMSRQLQVVVGEENTCARGLERDAEDDPGVDGDRVEAAGREFHPAERLQAGVHAREVHLLQVVDRVRVPHPAEVILGPYPVGDDEGEGFLLGVYLPAPAVADFELGEPRAAVKSREANHKNVLLENPAGSSRRGALIQARGFPLHHGPSG